MDGPVFIKSGVTLEGDQSDDYPAWTFFKLHEGANNENTEEDAMMVFDGVTDATVRVLSSRSQPWFRVLTCVHIYCISKGRSRLLWSLHT